MNRLFGTDGVRGVAGEYPLDEKTVSGIGHSLAKRTSEKLDRPARFVMGRDTRESGEWIMNAFHRGAVAAGANCESAGVITTPGVAYVTRAFEFDAGVVISASHNPFQDNGIKIFAPTGKKIEEAAERQIERDLLEHAAPAQTSTDSQLRESRIDEFHRTYLDHLANHFPGLSLHGKKIVIDCANGASSAFASPLFESTGAEVAVINDKPSGRNINAECGSLHLEHLQAAVAANEADFGVAFDGDADRALFVNEKGDVVDGDATLWILARSLKDGGQLKNRTVVATVMSNIGLEIALKSEGVELLRAAVGDKYVLDELIATGSDLGGEQSGHIIIPSVSLVGDGMMTALFVLEAMAERNATLSEAARGFTPYPQILVNVKVREKVPFESITAVQQAVREIESELAGSGRLLLRYSGTENLARVMIEGKDQEIVDKRAHYLADTIRSAIG